MAEQWIRCLCHTAASLAWSFCLLHVCSHWLCTVFSWRVSISLCTQAVWRREAVTNLGESCCLREMCAAGITAWWGCRVGKVAPNGFVLPMTRAARHWILHLSVNAHDIYTHIHPFLGWPRMKTYQQLVYIDLFNFKISCQYPQWVG